MHISTNLNRNLPFILLTGALLGITLGGCQLMPSKNKTAQETQGLTADCVQECELAQQQCEQRQEQREQECQTHEARTAEMASEDCAATSYGRCLDPVPCLGAEMRICKTQHEQCVRMCAPRTKAPALETEPETSTPEAIAPETEGSNPPATKD